MDGVISDEGVQVSSLRFNGPGTIRTWNTCDAPWPDSGLAWTGRAGRGTGSSPRGPTGSRAARLPLSVHEDQPLWIRVLVPPPNAGYHYNSLSIIDKVDDSPGAAAYSIRGLLGFEFDCSVEARILGQQADPRVNSFVVFVGKALPISFGPAIHPDLIRRPVCQDACPCTRHRTGCLPHRSARTRPTPIGLLGHPPNRQ